MGAGGSRPGEARRHRALLIALAALCSLLAQPRPARAFFFGVRSSSAQQSRGGREEKVPMTVVVPDYAPRPAPTLGPSVSPSSAAPAPAPVRGSDGGGGDEDGTPRLPSERRSSSPGAPSSGDHHGGAARAPAGAASADFISSSPAVPLPAGVTDSATVLPMPTPGHQRQDNVGMGTLQLQVRTVQLAVPLLMMLSFGALLVV